MSTQTRPDIFTKVKTFARAEEVAAARAADTLPFFRRLEAHAAPITQIEGRQRIMLGSNNYLGLTGDTRVVAAARAALDKFGTGLTGSRLLNGTIGLHLELEQELAAWMGTEDALVFTTGYQANVGCLSSLLGPQDIVIADSGDHASLLDGCLLSRAKLRPFRHNDMERLERNLQQAQTAAKGVLVVVDGVFSMEGDVAPLAAITELCNRYGARLMVDEAHACGVLGKLGTGASELFGVAEQVDLRMGTFSKSLASCGGFICGPADVIDYLRIGARSFLFTASGVPAAIGAALAAVRICRTAEGHELFAQVLERAEYLNRGLRALGYQVVEPTKLADGSALYTPIVPIVTGLDWKAITLWKLLYDAGVYCNVALHPAVPPGGALLRTSVMATHSVELLDRALAIFAAVKQQFESQHGPILAA